MKKVLFSLCVLFFLPIMSLGYYDDFNGYENYYKVIDSCDGVTTGLTADTVVGQTDVSGIGSTSAKVSNGFKWDKNGTASGSYIKGDALYSSSMIDISAITNKNLAFWYYLPPLSSGNITKVGGMLSDKNTINDASGSYVVATQTTIVSNSGWHFFKQPLTVGTILPDYSKIQSIKVGITCSNSLATATGIMVDDIRVVSNTNTTNGVWNEASGIWNIFTDGVEKVYCQYGNCDLTLPSVFVSSVSSAPQYKDFVYIAKMKYLDTETDYFGIVFKYQQSTKNYYIFDYNRLSSKVELRKYITGTGFSDVATTTVTFAPGVNTYFWLRVVSIGSNIKAYTSTVADPTTETDWTKQFDVSNLVYNIPGNIGLLAYSSVLTKGGGTVYFDKLKLLPIPSYASASSGDKEVKLGWISYSYTGEIASCNIYRSETSGGPYNKINTSTSISYTDTNVTNGTTYYYKVTANVVVGTSTEETGIALSSEVSATPHPGIVVSNNPFTPNSSNPAFQKVTFTVYNPGNDVIELKVYQPTGVLINTVTINGGPTISWDGTNSSGGVVEGGIYIYQIKTGGSVAGNGSIILAKWYCQK